MLTLDPQLLASFAGFSARSIFRTINIMSNYTLFKLKAVIILAVSLCSLSL